MNNFYNKIYNAVNEGITKSLNINNADPLQSEFIDLGLPSGTLWCSHNLGATCKTTSKSWYGRYYAWGETEPKNKEFNEFNYKLSNGWACRTFNRAFKKEVEFKLYKYNNSDEYGKIDNLKTLQPEDDAVSFNYSKNFPESNIAKLVKMPTEKQCKELKQFTTVEYVNDYNDIADLNGALFTSKINGNTLFIPAAGYRLDDEILDNEYECYLWTSSLNLDDPELAVCFDIDDNEYVSNSIHGRHYGLPVRAVYNK